MDSRSVVVTGLGFTTCLGCDQATVSKNLRELRHGLKVYPPFQAYGNSITVAASVPGFMTEGDDPEDWQHPGTVPLRLDQLRGLPPHGLYAVYAVKQALADAGLQDAQIQDGSTGLFTASAGSPTRLHYHLNRLINQGPQRVSPMAIVSSIAGTLNFNLVAYLGIQGASTGFVSACASSGHALGYAFDEIALGRQERMIVVGAEDINPFTVLPFVSMRVLSTSKDPDTASRPFDARRDGFVGTGGAVCLILESEAAARARRARVYSRFLGWGQATDGYHVAKSHPEGAGLAHAMRKALQASQLKAEDIDYVNAHATSTPHGDIAELKALKQVFGTGSGPAISSTKALTGHGLSLSSVMEAGFCNLALAEGFMPGSAHITELDQEAEGLHILRETASEGPQSVMSNSSGFGGANVSLLFGRVPA